MLEFEELFEELFELELDDEFDELFELELDEEFEELFELVLDDELELVLDELFELELLAVTSASGPAASARPRSRGLTACAASAPAASIVRVPATRPVATARFFMRFSSFGFRLRRVGIRPPAAARSARPRGGGRDGLTMRRAE